jgi:hypothetical protein
VASGCATLISKVNSIATDRLVLGAIVYDIKSRAPTFVSCSFIHVSRSCNEAAHVPAMSTEHDLEPTWYNDVLNKLDNQSINNNQDMY